MLACPTEKGKQVRIYGITVTEELRERFLRSVNIDGPIPEFRSDLGNCWLWTGTIDKRPRKNYGKFSPGRRLTIGAHRFSFLISGQEIPKGKQLDHLCRNPSCVRPSHLEPVTRRENILRGTSPAAINARKTHCENGHPLVVRSSGFRWCPICMAQWENDYKQKTGRAKNLPRPAR